MKKYSITARARAKRYVYPGKSQVTYENLANDPLVIESDYPVIFSDIFQFPLADGTIVKGCFALQKQSRQILSIVFDYWMKAELVCETISRIDFEPNTLWHTDQGKQFGADETTNQLLSKHFIASMSRAGTPTDNGYAERFVGIFKHAVVRKKKYFTFGEFLEEATKWINFYNYIRPHESLSQVPPVQFALQNNIKIAPVFSNLTV